MRKGAAFWRVFIPSTMGTSMNSTSLPRRHARRTKAVPDECLRAPVPAATAAMSSPFPSLPSACAASREAAVVRQARLTKPPGSLGRLERVAIDIAAWQATDRPEVRPCRALIFAADHPVAAAGVSPYPQAVTRAMVRNFLTGGAAAAVMVRHLHVPLDVIDVGVDGGRVAPACPGSTPRPQPRAADTSPPAAATYTRAAVADAEEADVRRADAMTHDVFAAAIAAGAGGPGAASRHALRDPR